MRYDFSHSTSSSLFSLLLRAVIAKRKEVMATQISRIDRTISTALMPLTNIWWDTRKIVFTLQSCSLQNHKPSYMCCYLKAGDMLIKVHVLLLVLGGMQQAQLTNLMPTSSAKCRAIFLRHQQEKRFGVSVPRCLLRVFPLRDTSHLIVVPVIHYDGFFSFCSALNLSLKFDTLTPGSGCLFPTP